MKCSLAVREIYLGKNSSKKVYFADFVSFVDISGYRILSIKGLDIHYS